jgi:hypothetical protein
VSERRLITHGGGPQSTNLADLLERVLDKGIVIVGDVKVLLADVELLTIKIRLVVCSVEKALAMGINWWQHDPYLKGLGDAPRLGPGAMTAEAAEDDE